ncbi:MAG TPA: hypothetical protein VFS33_03565 [Gemmatimonadales bacterium]|nr:hypothetical protein [Gemmatimonadales bacterium]
MLNWPLGTLLTGTVVAAALGAAAPGPGSPTPRAHTDSTAAWARYFRGTWHCQGAFASGKPLAADIAFTALLGGRWLQYHHTDRAPGAYEALALWGPTTGTAAPPPTTFYDNFGGTRRFISAGWQDSALVFVRDTTERGARAERFAFRQRSDTAFWFAWELQRPSGAGWVVGDSLTCARAAA